MPGWSDIICDNTEITEAYKKIDLPVKYKKGKLKITFHISTIPGKSGCVRCINRLKEASDYRLCYICTDLRINYFTNIFPKCKNRINICPAFLYCP